MGVLRGSIIKAIKGDARSLDNGSYRGSKQDKGSFQATAEPVVGALRSDLCWRRALRARRHMSGVGDRDRSAINVSLGRLSGFMKSV